jgi:hypothetical protein
MPSDAKITQCLQRIVRDALRTGEEEITINLARQRAEEELDLEEDYFKSDAKWKVKSKEIIQNAVAAGEEDDGEEERSVEQMSRKGKGVGEKAKVSKVVSKGKEMNKKRKSESSTAAASKRRKKAVVDSDDEEEEEEEEVDPEIDSDEAFDHSGKDMQDEDEDSIDAQPHKVKNKGKAEENDDDKSQSVLSDPPDDTVSTTPADQEKTGVDNDNGNESEMSILLDSPPPKKKRKSNSTTTTKTGPSKPKATSKSKTAAAADNNPSDAEIKRLQSQLSQCGYRKQWHRELATYTSSSDKIRHLKSLLSDMGIKGRFSADKARAIKEARELKEEIEAAREFEKRWGADEGSDDDDEQEEDDDEEEEAGRGSRRATNEESAPPRQKKGVLPKGLVDFGNSGDEASD